MTNSKKNHFDEMTYSVKWPIRWIDPFDEMIQLEKWPFRCTESLDEMT